MKIPFIQTGKLRLFPALTLLFALLFGASTAVADLVGPYTPDANTLFLVALRRSGGWVGDDEPGHEGWKFL